MNDLVEYLTRRINKPHHFLELYEKEFAPFRDEPVSLLEIGVQNGGSLELWRKYFTKAEIYGLDIESVKPVEGTEIVQGDQTDLDLLSKLPDLDIVIDDGGHTMRQQQVTFDALFPRLKAGGLYIIEDLETSYMGEYQDAPVTTVEWLKSHVESVNKGKYDIASISFIRDLAVIKKV